MSKYSVLMFITSVNMDLLNYVVEANNFYYL